MLIPTKALAAALVPLVPAGVSVIQGPRSSFDVPALIIRADEPWISPSRFCHDDQRYVAVAVVSAATPQDGEQMLYEIILSVMDNLPSGWRFVSAGSPLVDETTGMAYLAAPIRLSYQHTLEEES